MKNLESGLLIGLEQVRRIVDDIADDELYNIAVATLCKQVT